VNTDGGIEVPVFCREDDVSLVGRRELASTSSATSDELLLGIGALDIVTGWKTQSRKVWWGDEE